MISEVDFCQIFPDFWEGMKDVTTLYPYETDPFPVKKDQTNMGKQTQSILKSFLAPSRSLGNPFDLSKIFGEEGNDLIRLPIIGGAGDNGVRLE
jgi:hypothetical protein